MRTPLLLVLVLVSLSSCDCGSDPAADGGTGGVGPGPGGAGGGGGGSGGGAGGGAGSGGGSAGTGGGSAGSGGGCADPCVPGEACIGGVCVPEQSCATNDDCDFDTRCDAGSCVPWASGPAADAGCLQLSTPGLLSPRVKCEFSVAPPGDPFPGHVDVQGTPVVASFRAPGEAGPPSVAASFTATVVGGYTEDQGVIRVLRGDDCTLEANLGGTDLDGDGTVDYTVSPATLAAADLDGDRVPELVAAGADGSTFAFTRKSGVWSLLWRAPLPAGAPWGACCALGWGGPSIHDLDDDGLPEIIREGVVLGADGSLRSLAPPGYASYRSGLFPILANLDEDPAIELTNGQLIWEWTLGAWAQEPLFPGAVSSAPGHAAVADFGAYGTGPSTDAEVAIVRDDLVMVQALDGSYAMAPVPVPGDGGGPPTVSDFDGDGLVEVGVAGGAFYTVYDIDCGPSPRPGGACAPGSCDGLAGPCPGGSSLLWSRATQDLSSNVTGSSIFDFEADGASEVLYGDECFTRIYDGRTGDVLFSQYRSSCTWNENPIIADTDGNFRADLVTPSNKACSPDGSGIACVTLNADGVDPQWNGVRCRENADCFSRACDSGLCRCTGSGHCCAEGTGEACEEAGLRCAPPNPGTGGGNTCRASHPHGVSGLRIYSDANDRWVRSRKIWSQHAYAVTHIDEDGTVPRSSQWQKNWMQPELNNFRQNVPGDPNGNAVADATAGTGLFEACTPENAAVLTVGVCNRGAAPQGAGLTIGFYALGVKVCEAATTVALAPGECEQVSCVWGSPPDVVAGAVDVEVVANDGGAAAECNEGNNTGRIEGVQCPILE